MRLRGATNRDLKELDRLLECHKFKILPKHIEMIVVVEDDDGSIIGAGILVTQLEGLFVTNMDKGIRGRVECMKMILNAADVETKSLGYDAYHAMNVTNDKVAKTFKKSFGFQDMIGSNLIKFVE